MNKLINKLYLNTPLIESEPLSRLVASTVYLKMEALQPSGSFKNRGIGHLCIAYAKEKARCFVAASGGNAGLAVAYSGKKLQIPVKVVVPIKTPELMKAKIIAEGAEVILHGNDFSESETLALDLSKAEGYRYIPPYDHPLIWEGHSSLVQEVADEGIKPDAVILSVGGGGLLCGIVQGLQNLKWNSTFIITAETEGAASFAQSVKAGHIVTLNSINTIATSLGAKRVAEEAFNKTKTHPIIPEIVTDRQAVEACRAFADHHRLLVEPACGTALALLYQKAHSLKKFKSLLVIVCGGNIVSLDLLKEWNAKIE